MLTDRFADALVFAENVHREQRRKGNDIPYVAHLMAVAATVLEWGGDEDTAIAGLLHDAVEDQGGEPMAQKIQRRFGDRVVDLVLHCTDSTTVDPAAKLPWEKRKTAYLTKLLSAGPDAALITVADKVHNLKATLRDLRAQGPAALDRFARPDRLVWYYTSVANALAPHARRAPIQELREAVVTLVQLVPQELGGGSDVRFSMNACSPDGAHTVSSRQNEVTVEWYDFADSSPWESIDYMDFNGMSCAALAELLGLVSGSPTSSLAAAICGQFDTYSQVRDFADAHAIDYHHRVHPWP